MPGLLTTEYDPEQVSSFGDFGAGLLGAGYAANSTLDQLKRAFQRGSAALASTSQDSDMQAEAARMRGLADQTTQDMSENARLYAPVREAYPYATALGEAAPAAAAGGLAALRAQAMNNTAGAYLEELGKAINNPQLLWLSRFIRGAI